MGLFSGIGKIFSSAVDSITGDGLLGFGADLIGGALTNSANAAQATNQQNFQADQTGTAYQRAVKDLQAAGLNPMLAYQNGGAASGSGASATMQNAVGSAVHTGLAAKRNAADVANLQATVDKTKTDIVNSTAQTKSNIALNRILGVKALADAGASSATAAATRAGLPYKQLEGSFWSGAGDVVRSLGNFNSDVSRRSSSSSGSVTPKNIPRAGNNGVPIHSSAF